MDLDRGTWLQSEECAPNGGQTRKGAAIYPDGKTRVVWAGIPDPRLPKSLYFSVPAHGRISGKYVSGYLQVDEVVYGDGSTLRWWGFKTAARS